MAAGGGPAGATATLATEIYKRAFSLGQFGLGPVVGVDGPPRQGQVPVRNSLFRVHVALLSAAHCSGHMRANAGEESKGNNCLLAKNLRPQNGRNCLELGRGLALMDGSGQSRRKGT